MIGVFVFGSPAKAYAIAPVRLTKTQAVLEGPADIVWERSPDAVHFTWEGKRYRVARRQTIMSGVVQWHRFPYFSGWWNGWRLLRVEDQNTKRDLVAHEFSRQLIVDLGEEQVQWVNRANILDREAGRASFCRSHDLYDSNMTMAQAFERVLGRKCRIGGDCDADLALWSAAWEFAIENGFWLVGPRPWAAS